MQIDQIEQKLSSANREMDELFRDYPEGLPTSGHGYATFLRLRREIDDLETEWIMASDWVTS